MSVHTPVNPRPRLWRVCKLIQGYPQRVVKVLDGLEHLPESLAISICAALEEARPGVFFIESLAEAIEPNTPVEVNDGG